jgi:hypothetical protein
VRKAARNVLLRGLSEHHRNVKRSQPARAILDRKTTGRLFARRAIFENEKSYERASGMGSAF